MGTKCVLAKAVCAHGAVVYTLRNRMTCTNLIGAALLAAAEQVVYRHDTRPFLSCEGAGPPD